MKKRQASMKWRLKRRLACIRRGVRNRWQWVRKKGFQITATTVITLAVTGVYTFASDALARLYKGEPARKEERKPTHRGGGKKQTDLTVIDSWLHEAYYQGLSQGQELEVWGCDVCSNNVTITRNAPVRVVCSTCNTDMLRRAMVAENLTHTVAE